MTPLEFKQLLEKQVIVIDGAMGTMLQNRSLGKEVFGGEEFQMLFDLLTFSRPRMVRELHLEYFKAGANIVETNTFGASPLRLEDFDFSRLDISAFDQEETPDNLSRLSMAELAYILNKKAAEAARDALEKYREDPSYDNRPLLVAGSIGPSNRIVSSANADLKKADFQQVRENFYLQALGLIDGRADLMLLETQQDILELKAAIFGVRQAMKEKGVALPIIAQVTIDRFSRMPIFNTDIHAALVCVQEVGVDVFGLNCGVGPEEMQNAVQKLSRTSKLPISVVPNAGFPSFENGMAVYDLGPKEMAATLKKYIQDYGVNIIGGCCGSTPEHIKELSRTAAETKPASRNIDETVYISGPQKAVKLCSEQSLILIGERLNVRGSKKVRDAVENSSPINHSALEEVAEQQTRGLGLEIIDVCMDSNVVDTETCLVEVVKSQTLDFPAAMSLDSFEPKALEKAILAYPGRPIINSISLEDSDSGEDRLDAVLKSTAEHAPVYIALLTGPEGPAAKADEKVDLARRIIEKARDKYGVKPEQLIIDLNIFPLGSETEEGLNFAGECLSALPRIKNLAPGIKTIAGAGNLTSGLARKPYMRKALASVFLDKARKQGLDAAIVNPNHYAPVDTLDKGDVLLAEKAIMERDMEAFAKLEEIALAKKGIAPKLKTNRKALDPISNIRQKIRAGLKQYSPGVIKIGDFSYEYTDKIAPQLALILQETDPLVLINKHLSPIMEELGRDFASGLVSLPHLIKSADVIKQGMNFIEAYIQNKTNANGEKSASSKGVIVLGTVYQDIHNIGKDLTKTLMGNHGFKVIDLGVQAPNRQFVDAAEKNRATAIAMSALLVQTANHMATVSSMLKERNMGDIPILIGGASVNWRHAAYVAMAGESDPSKMRDNVFYCRSAMDGINYLNQLSDPDKKADLLKSNGQRLAKAYQSGIKILKARNKSEKELPKRQVSFEKKPLAKNNFIPRQKLEYSLKEFSPFLNKDLLFRQNWRYGSSKNWAKKGVSREELEKKLKIIIEEADAGRWIRPQAVFASFLCRGGENTVTMLGIESGRELGEFYFNDFIGKDKKDIFNVAQYFHPREDIIGLQLATSGFTPEAMPEISEDQELLMLLSGLSNRVAEDMAERASHVMGRMIFGKTSNSVRRYSPGFSVMEELKNNKLIVKLLEADKRMKIKLTESCQLYPSASTAAVVCFHPEAGYR